MGYFSNGAEGDFYEAEFCSRCAHRDDVRGCPVWNAHLLFAYQECDSGSNAETILNMLIPIAANAAKNERCAMFVPAKGLRKR